METEFELREFVHTTGSKVIQAALDGRKPQSTCLILLVLRRIGGGVERGVSVLVPFFIRTPSGAHFQRKHPNEPGITVA